MSDRREAGDIEQPEAEPGTGARATPEPGLESQAPEPLARIEGEALEAFHRLAAEITEFRELTRRARADLDRLERRSSGRSQLPDEVLERLFPLLDGLQAAAASPAGPGFIDGLQVLGRELHSVLGALGARQYSPLPGDRFDAGRMRPEEETGDEPAEVAEVLHPGWEVGGAVVAPARVALRRLAATAGEAPGGEPSLG